jgi:hypothetical protein
MSLFSTNFHNKYFHASDQPLQICNTFEPKNAVSFVSTAGEVARIDIDGIMHFTIEANDENALKFVACIESIIGRKLTGVEVTKKP